MSRYVTVLLNVCPLQPNKDNRFFILFISKGLCWYRPSLYCSTQLSFILWHCWATTHLVRPIVRNKAKKLIVSEEAISTNRPKRFWNHRARVPMWYYQMGHSYLSNSFWIHRCLLASCESTCVVQISGVACTILWYNTILIGHSEPFHFSPARQRKV